ncbi:hypothetical protein [Veillonella sp. VA142]|uniref:hypothetical protein n=1 Tax=Veillonella sp. VA142 TaxID=741834 RepID=UPI000F8C9D4D|nr:hypothetical protein [Veillonella sp. VA142]
MSDLTTKKLNIAKSRERIKAIQERRQSLKEKLEKQMATLTQKERSLQKDIAIKLFATLEEVGIDFYSSDSNGIAFVIGATMKALENPSMHDALIALGETRFTTAPSLDDNSSSTTEEPEQDIDDE